MDSGSARGDCDDIHIITIMTDEVVFKSIDIWTERCNPVGIERFLDVALLSASWRHVGEAEVDAVVVFHY